MLRSASLSLALFGFLALLTAPALAEVPAAAPAAAPAAVAHEAPAAAPAAVTPEAPKVETPAPAPVMEPAKTETPKAEPAKPTEKSVGKMRDRWKKMTPEQKEEMRKKAEGRLGERYDRLKTAEQENIKNIMAEISKLNKEQRSILMAKIRQQASKDRAARKAMKAMENSKKETAPAADPNAVKH